MYFISSFYLKIFELIILDINQIKKIFVFRREDKKCELLNLLISYNLKVSRFLSIKGFKSCGFLPYSLSYYFIKIPSINN